MADRPVALPGTDGVSLCSSPGMAADPCGGASSELSFLLNRDGAAAVDALLRRRGAARRTTVLLPPHAADMTVKVSRGKDHREYLLPVGYVVDQPRSLACPLSELFASPQVQAAVTEVLVEHFPAAASSADALLYRSISLLTALSAIPVGPAPGMVVELEAPSPRLNDRAVSRLSGYRTKVVEWAVTDNNW
ncbi:hypothetical protein ACIBCR_28170 [Micromonospora echinospora]|uniref:hypothetical protein n=1 Tax=Micromonospora echinospora TaxID=1877 RepID=UPI00378C4976